MLTRKLLSVIDNLIVDVFKIICCSEPTDSFMVNVTVYSSTAGQRFTAGARAPAGPLGAATAHFCPDKRDIWHGGADLVYRATCRPRGAKKQFLDH